MGRTTSDALVKEIVCTTAIPKMTLVKAGAADNTVIPAVSGAATIIGISGDVDAASGDRASIFMDNCIVPAIAGGTIGRGVSVTADASGRAVAAATPGQSCIGYAEISAVILDQVTVLIDRHYYAAPVA